MGKTHRYFLELAYDGTNYHGWQVQPNAVTIQEKLNHCLSTLLREEIHAVGSGRTDTGVHAKQQFAHFDTQIELNNKQFTHKLNSFLPHDLAVRAVVAVPSDAHARFSAEKRSYEYHITLTKNPFLLKHAYLLRHTPNLELMNDAAKHLLTQTDFPMFSKVHSDSPHFLCNLYEAYWERKENQLIFHISANRFLRGMVRLIVGALLEVGAGKMSIQEFRNLVEHQDTSWNRSAAPAHGLFLSSVTYPEELGVNQRTI